MAHHPTPPSSNLNLTPLSCLKIRRRGVGRLPHPAASPQSFLGGSPSPRGFPFPGSPTVVALTRQGHPDNHTRFSVSERGSFLEVEVWSVPPSLFVGRQSRYAAEATSCTAALQHLHCPHSLLWSDLLGHFLLFSVFSNFSLLS